MGSSVTRALTAVASGFVLRDGTVLMQVESFIFVQSELFSLGGQAGFLLPQE